MSLWLVGTGPHAREYAKVLKNLNQEYIAIGRGPSSAFAFETETGHPVRPGGLESALAEGDPPSKAIIAVSFEQLASVASRLIEAGTKAVLLEKPGGINGMEIGKVAALAANHKASVLIAYNRRFYASTSHARHMIAEDGGPVTCLFEFTEWAHTIEPLAIPAEVKEAWVIANSSHVLDLAFHLCGFPKDWKYWHSGRLSWHSAAARFCGSGVTDKDVLFSYIADWGAPGRWGVEICTRNRRFIWRPLEKLHVINLNSLKAEPVELDDGLDINFKPGIYNQTKAFLQSDNDLFCTISDQVKNSLIYSKMAGYQS